MKRDEFEETKRRLSEMRNKSVEEEKLQIDLLMISALKTYFELER